jgi:DtxR family Mn-dependent transcriptional regulator
LARDMISPTIEDYLGILFIMEKDGEAVQGVRIAELLGVTPPTVTNTLKRMLRDGLVCLDNKSGFQLTDQGREAARSVMRRHMLTEWMVAKMLPWSKLHNEAHSLEHAISDEVEQALLKDLNQPELCPHGNPLPGFEDLVSAWIPLTDIAPHERVIIRRIHEFAEDTPNLLSFLEDNGILNGVEAQVERVLPFNQTIDLNIQGKVVALGLSTARYIFVERVV